MMARVVFGTGLERRDSVAGDRCGLSSLEGTFLGQEVLQLGRAADVSLPVWADTTIGDVVYRAIKLATVAPEDGLVPFTATVHTASKGADNGNVFARFLKRLRFRSLHSPVRDTVYGATLHSCQFHSGVVLMIEVEKAPESTLLATTGIKRPRSH